MNKNVKNLIAFVLMICIFASTLLFSSCDFHSDDNYFPEGYTGGFGIERGSGAAYYWVETYAECQAAIELLKSHSSTFAQSVIFTYEGDLFDTKYCFYINRGKADKIKYGENPFDRYAEDVRVSSYAFYDDVTIDELVYSHVMKYQSYGISYKEEFISLYKNDPRYKFKLTYEYISNNKGVYLEDVSIYSSNQETHLLTVYCKGYGDKEKPIPELGLNAILYSLSIIE